jgi:uncharacterized protein (TIGR02145 family)
MKKTILLFAFLAFSLFSCSSSDNNNSNSNSVVTDIDGNVYNTIVIGNQTWTKENLNVSKYRNGDPILRVDDSWDGLTTGAWCYYANQTSNGVVYGKLYNWYAINDPRGIAPEGYHVPNIDEWILLRDFLITNGNNYDGTVTGNKIGKSLSSTTLWDETPNEGAVGNDLTLNNSSSFSGLPGGVRWSDPNVDFNAIRRGAYWWSSSASTNNATSYSLNANSDDLRQLGFNKKYGMSIRCVKD